LRCVSRYQPIPSCDSPLKSSFSGSPRPVAVSMNIWLSGLFERPSEIGSVSAERSKYGSISSQVQPGPHSS
jgi:hypothetical protein